MANEAVLSHATSSEANPNRPMWSALTRWWAPAATTSEPELGYESAHPWTLGDDASRDAGAESY